MALDTPSGASVPGGAGHTQAVANAGPALVLSPGPAASQPCDPESLLREARSQARVKYPEPQPAAAVLGYLCTGSASLSLWLQVAPSRTRRGMLSSRGATFQRCPCVSGLPSPVPQLSCVIVVRLRPHRLMIFPLLYEF